MGLGNCLHERGDQAVPQDQRGNARQENHPDPTHFEGGNRVQVLPQDRQSPHAIGDHDNRGEASGKNTKVIHEGIEYIQHVQT